MADTEERLEAPVQGFACRRCGRVYSKRRSLTRARYCPTGCGVEAQMEWNAFQREMGRRFRVAEGG